MRSSSPSEVVAVTHGTFGLDIAEAGVRDRVIGGTACPFAGGGEVDEDLVLGVEPDGFADEFGEVEVVRRAVDSNVDSVVAVPVRVDAGFDACGFEHAHGPCFEDAGAVGVGDVVAAAVVDDDGFDACIVQQVREHESRGSGSDDCDVCLKLCHLGLLACLFSTVCAQSRT
jgi:hypothetical protein